MCDDVYKKSRLKDSVHYSWNGKDNLNKVEGVFDFEPKLRELASHPKLVTTARHILNTTEPLDTYISKFFPMEPEIGSSTYFHQDNFYFRGDSRKIVSCAVYLEDTNKENGCLRIAEESHRYGLFPHDVDSEIPFVKWILIAHGLELSEKVDASRQEQALRDKLLQSLMEAQQDVDTRLKRVEEKLLKRNDETQQKFSIGGGVSSSPPPPVVPQSSCAFASNALSLASTSTSYFDIDAPLADFAAVPFVAILTIEYSSSYLETLSLT